MKKETLAGLGLLGGIAGGVSLISVQLADRFNEENSPPELPQTPSTRDFSAEIKRLVGTKEKNTVRTLLANYEISWQSLEFVYSTAASIDGSSLGSTLSDEAISGIEQRANEVVLGSAYLAQLLLPPAESLKIDISPDKLRLGDVEFNLKDSFELQVAASILRLKLAQYGEFSGLVGIARGVRVLIDQTEEVSKDKAFKRLTDELEWLAQAKDRPKITLEKGSYALLPTESLVTLSRLMKHTSLAGIPYPREIIFTPWRNGAPGVGWYLGADNAGHPFAVVITNRSDKDGLVHEWGHSVSFAYQMPSADPQLNAYSQGAFDAKIQGRPIKAQNNVEEYANAFNRYFMEGDGFRKSIIEGEGDRTSQGLEREEYRFMKNLFAGQEFRWNGIPPVRLNERLGEDTRLEIGDVIEITDTDIERPGIFLRPTPSLAIDPNYPTVWDRYSVKIVGGPEFLYDKRGREVVMWEVEVGDFSTHTKEFFQDIRGPQRDWISQEWLGRELLSVSE